MLTIHGGWRTRYGLGGAGNPGGYGMTRGYVWSGSGENGTGGLLIIYINNLNNNGKIETNGSKGGIGDGDVISSGGCSGGGSINIFYKQNINQNGNVEANGGETTYDFGGEGGKGSISIGKILNGTYENTFKNY